mmetsp:Transcript_9014/g.23052  ORF Transcript_9014/g.23052 Transcript_9014/m.23052 type:complete len:303 (-) Transcript_9014:89-997(-)
MHDYLRLPRDPVKLVVEIAERARDTEHHLGEAALLRRHNHRRTVAALGLAATARVVSAADRVLIEDPAARAVGAKDVIQVLGALKHVRVVVDRQHARVMQPLGPVLDVGGRVLRYELVHLDRRPPLGVGLARHGEHAARIANGRVDEGAAVDDSCDRARGTAVDCVVAKLPLALVHFHDEHAVAHKRVGLRLDRLVDGLVAELEALLHHGVGLARQPLEVLRQVHARRVARHIGRELPVVMAVAVKDAKQVVGLVQLLDKVGILVLLGAVARAAAVRVLVHLDPKARRRRRLCAALGGRRLG